MSQLSNDEKARLYDNYVRQSEILLRENSKLKSEFAGNAVPVKERVFPERVTPVTVGEDAAS